MNHLSPDVAGRSKFLISRQPCWGVPPSYTTCTSDPPPLSWSAAIFASLAFQGGRRVLLVSLPFRLDMDARKTVENVRLSFRFFCMTLNWTQEIHGHSGSGDLAAKISLSSSMYPRQEHEFPILFSLHLSTVFRVVGIHILPASHIQQIPISIQNCCKYRNLLFKFHTTHQ